MEYKEPNVGDVIVFYDSKGRPHNALVTVRYSEKCINAVYVSHDEDRTDSYGRQIERTATCMYGDSIPAHSNYWRWPEEQPNPYHQPAAT